MNPEIIHTEKGDLSYCKMSNEIISTPSEFLDLMMNCPTEIIVLDKEALHKGFFELRTGLAGEILQKISNYRKRLVVLGSFDNIESKSLNDFIYESNKTGKAVFTETIEEAINLLK